MNFRLILMLSAFGLAMGIASVTGLLRPGVETIVWLVVSVFCGVVISRQAPGRFFLHGFLTGFIAGVVASIVQVVFFDSYLDHNPNAEASFGQLPPNMSPRMVVLIMTPVIALVYGVVLGFIAWVAGKTAPRRSPAAT